MVLRKEPPGVRCRVSEHAKRQQCRRHSTAIDCNHLFKIVTVMLVVAGPMLKSQAGFLSWFGKKSMIDEYDLLNLFLVRRVPDSDAPDKNIIAAQQLIREYRDGKRSEAGIELPSEQAMIQFTSLINLMDPEEPHCDLYARNILADNAEAEAADVFRPIGDRPPLRRIGMVIWQVAYDHAKECFEEYPRKFARLLKHVFDRRVLVDIVNIMQDVIKTSNTIVAYIDSLREMHPHQRSALKSKGVLVASKAAAKVFLTYLRQKTRHEQEFEKYLWPSSSPLIRNKLEVHEHKVVAIMDKYIYDRCDVMFSAFGSVLGPAELEVQLFRDQYKYKAANRNMANFMIWLEYYRLCKEIIDNKVKVEDSVIETIWEEHGVRG